MIRSPVALTFALLALGSLGGLSAGACLEPDDAVNAPLAPWGQPSDARDSPTAVSSPAAPSRERPTGTARGSGGGGDATLARLSSKPLRYTRHGQCRMACRHITEQEVRALLDDGHVAPDRTRDDGECVSYAVEGRTDDGQDVRVVYADCARETRVVTTIDLDRDWPCECR